METSKPIILLKTRQLKENDELPDSQYRDIAKLIFDTDEYIFPALFEGKRDPRAVAEDVISYVLKKGTDSLFCKNNLFVCCDGQRIAGMILWYKGTMEWNYEEFLQAAKEIGVELKRDNLEAINQTFFESQKADSNSHNADTITLFNVCVDKSARGSGVGSYMINSFISCCNEYNMELCVLKCNEAAVKLYKKNGFEITSEYPGFSQSQTKPDCYSMLRKHKKTI